ncbi:MAG: hypothetical protein WAO16_08120 [Pseudolabrys sp.]
MQRREFIMFVGGAAAWPITARAQQSDRVRRIGLFIGIEDDAASKAYREAFRQGLEQLGWIDGRNVRIDARFGPFAVARTQRNWWRLRRMSSWLLAVFFHTTNASGKRHGADHLHHRPRPGRLRLRR